MQVNSVFFLKSHPQLQNLHPLQFIFKLEYATKGGFILIISEWFTMQRNKKMEHNYV